MAAVMTVVTELDFIKHGFYAEVSQNFGYTKSIEEAASLINTYEKNTFSKFCVSASDKGFGEKDMKNSHHILFETNRPHDNNQTIPFDGVPFMILGRRVLDCQYGVDHQKHSKEKYKSSRFKKARFLSQPTIKRDCPAKIMLREVVAFPKYKIDKNTVWRRKNASQKIRDALKNNTTIIDIEHRIYISLPVSDNHRNHVIGEKPRKPQTRRSAKSTARVSTTSKLHKISKKNRKFSDGFMKLVERCNNATKTQSDYTPFFIDEKRVGSIRPNFWNHLQHYTDVFILNASGVHLNPLLCTHSDRSQSMECALQDLRRKNCLLTLKGWRDECYSVYHRFNESPLMKIERSAACLLGLKHWGVHINCHVKHSVHGPHLWIARRSMTKQTFPGFWDNMVGGGLATGLGIMECAAKECQEEAGVPLEYIHNLRPAGTVSCLYEDDRGVIPGCLFVMDMEVPEEWLPCNQDGEVGEFKLVTIEQVKELIITEEFKYDSALVILDFLIRHNHIKPDEEPNYMYLVEQIHTSLP